MNTFKKSLVTAAVACGMALASQAARADLIIIANGTTVADVANTNTSNGTALYTGSVGGFDVNVLTAIGVGEYGNSGTLLDVGSLNVSATGAGSLTLMFEETNLTSPAASQAFQADFSATITGASVTRSVYFDGTNQGLETSLIGQVTGANGSFVGGPFAINGAYSLTEEIDVTATGQGATLSSDDRVSVPEPAALSLMGLGLSAIAFARRRKSA